MNQLEDLLQQCTVKLTISGQRGTGFFVAPGSILTCAHVVDGAGESPIQVMWNNQENWAQAIVVRLLPKPYDLALLKVDIPIGANPPCVYLSSEIQSRDPLYLFGYPDIDYPNGCPATFGCEGLTGDDPQIIKFASGQVRPGMSGSPLLNQRTGNVCGIVQFTRDRSFDLGGGAIRASVILAKFPELLEQQQSLHQQDRRWSNFDRDRGIDWLDRSRQLLAAQKHLTTNRLLKESTSNFDDIHVPLGLIERKERPKVKEEPSPEQGSQLYQTEYTETKRFEHEAFLAEVVGKPARGKHIAIIGEPGAGKTTLLTKIGVWLIEQAGQQPEEPLVVAWISLASLETQKLSEYFYGSWLDSAHPAACPPPSWKNELIKLVGQKRVWLLLDGLDETSKSDSLIWLKGQLAGWGQNLRVVMTCRINQWEASAGGNALTDSFEVYRTLDYSYQTSQGEDQVKEFISKWFADNEKVATQICTELDAPGKERIKDLVKNPLRLTLLCASWEKDNQSLPETQAGLYEKFVDYLYDWKAVEFSKEVELREELDLALGKLAKEGLNRQPMNDGAVRRFRFTKSEIKGLWGKQSKELLAAAKNLGWLNVVEKDTYAFYHPTFQEYFAACSIDDWDYFLPRAHVDRPVNCQGEDKPTYRVFESEWRQPMLLWFGRDDLNYELKENFIDKLMNFQEQEGKFYYYRAYCMAAIFIGEFRSLPQVEEIVRQIVRWAVGYFDTEKQAWMTFLDRIQSFTIEIISFTHRGCAIDTLIQSLKQFNVEDNNLSGCKIVYLLGRIDTGSVNVINTLLQLLQKPDVEHELRGAVMSVLSSIGKGDTNAINALRQFLKQLNVDNEIICYVAAALGSIEDGNKEAINALLQLLQQPDLSEDLRTQVNIRLSDIAVGNKEAIDMLLQILLLQDLSDEILFEFLFTVGSILSDIAIGNKKAINTLLQLLPQPELSKELLCNVGSILSDIAIGNKKAINTLLQLLPQPELSEEILCTVGSILSDIAVGNKEAIDTLLQLLQQPELSEKLLNTVGSILSDIAVVNAEAIDTLLQLLQQPELSEELRAVITYILSCYMGNKKAIDTLIQILQQPELSDELCASITTILGQTVEGNKEVINNLIKLLQQPDLSDEICDELTSILYDISAKNKGAIYSLNTQKSMSFDQHDSNINDRQTIDNLIELLQQPDLSNEIRSGIASLLHDIVVGDKKEIDTRCKLLQQMDLSDEISYVVTIIILFDIDVGNKKEIDNLIKLLQKSELSDELRYKVTCSLGYWIERGNKEVIDTLLQIIQQLELSDGFFLQVPFALQKILTKQTMSSTIWQLKKYSTDEVYQSNFKKFKLCDQIIFHCAKTLSYQEFHSAWHQFCLPVSPFSS
jgi:energy-coupling factor transporter ATP-binding protein EcfA2